MKIPLQKNQAITNFFFYFSAFFALWVCIFWVIHHIDYFTAFLGPGETLLEHFFYYTLPLSTSLLALLFVSGIIYAIKRTLAITLRISPFALIISLFLWVIFIFFWVGYVRLTTPFNSAMLDTHLFIIHVGNLIIKASSLIAWILSISLITYIVGEQISRKLTISHLVPQSLLITTSFAIGFFTLFLISFFAYSAHIGTPIFFIGLFIALLVVFRKSTTHILKAFFATRTVTLHILSNHFWIYLTVLFTIALNLIDGIQTEPSGFDTSTYYLNRAQLIAEGNALVPGGLPYPFEILASIGYLFNGDASFASGLNLLFIVLGALVVRSFVYKITKHSIAADISLITWITLPVTQNYIFFEMKPDALAFLGAILSLHYFFLWVQQKKETRLFFLGVFFMIFAVSLKATMLFIATAICAALIIPLVKWRVSLREKVRLILLAALVGLLPLVLWIIHAIAHPSPDTKPLHEKLFISHHPTAPHISEEGLSAIGIDSESCVSTQHTEDFSRYTINNHETPWGILLAPWSLTMNENRAVMSYGMNISLIFLALFPLWLFQTILRSPHKKPFLSKGAYSFIFLSGIVHWVLWYYLAEGVVWYGFVGFFYLALLIGHIFTRIQHKALYIFAAAILWFNILCMLSLRLFNFSPPPVIFTVAANIKTKAMHYEGVSRILNAQENKHKKILLTASQSVYHIVNNDKRVLYDRHLDQFNCLYSSDHEKTLMRLKSFDVDYILLTKDLHNIDQSQENTLQEKMTRLRAFAADQLSISYESNELILYRIP